MNGSSDAADFNKSIGLSPSFSMAGEVAPSTTTPASTTPTVPTTPTTPAKLTTGQKIKAAINDGTVTNTAKAASSWLDAIGNGINSFKNPSSSSTTSNVSAASTTTPDTSTGFTVPVYVWWVGGGIVSLGIIWALIHFNAKKVA